MTTMARHPEFASGLRSLFKRLTLIDPGTSEALREEEWVARKLSGRVSARTFSRWWTGEVLPQRKKWQYVAVEVKKEIDDEPDLLRQLEALRQYIQDNRRRYEEVDRPEATAVRPRRLSKQRAAESSPYDPEARLEDDIQAEGALPLKLTPEDPLDDRSSQRAWEKLTSKGLNQALNDKEWAWLTDWLPEGMPVSRFDLVYHRNAPPYQPSPTPLAQQVVEQWCATTTDQDVPTIKSEPLGLQVRITSLAFDHSTYKYVLHLAPTKFLYYAAIQQNLWNPKLKELRRFSFENALFALDRGQPLTLPSQFAIHMAVISSDRKALLRRRAGNTKLYPYAWEAGIGEFMHGPARRTKFPHFERGKPSLEKFLRNAVAEELNYQKARSSDFKLFGFAAEYRTLGPKLIAVYRSEAPIAQLLEGAKTAHDRTRSVAAVDLTADGVAEAVTDPRYPTWGPTSKLALLLALMQDSPKADVVKEVADRIRTLKGAPSAVPPK